MISNLETTFSKWYLLYQLYKFKDLSILMKCGIVTVITKSLLRTYHAEVTDRGLRCAILLKYETKLNGMFPL